VTRRSRFVCRGVCSILAVLCAIVRCSSGDDPARPKPLIDVISPAAVTDLTPCNPTDHSVMLTWTAPGDDVAVGTAALYDIRYSTAMIGTATWISASRSTGEPPPGAAGDADTFVATGLSPNTSYYFALKAADDGSNWSPLSNVARRMTLVLLDTIPPAAVTDLAVTHRTAHEIQLTWTAPGNDGDAGTAASYDIRYSISPISEANWRSAVQAELEPAPNYSRSRETFSVPGLSANTEYYFALKTADQRLNLSALSNVARESTLPCTFCWLPIGSGMGSDGMYGPNVKALTVYDGTLIAGGYFTAAGGVPADNIAAWNGSSWSPLGRGVNNAVNAFTIHDAKLIAAKFPDPSSPGPLCSWDGSSWSPIPGMDLDTILALTSYNAQLIAGGTFDNAGGVAARAIAAWNGSYWLELGGGMSGGSHSYGHVYAIAVYHGQLIAAGDFGVAGCFAANHIAAWDGISWSPLGSGLSGGSSPRVNALAVYNDQLIAAGSFAFAGGIPAGNIAAWNGISWSPLGSGVDGGAYPGVEALAIHGGQLIAGGDFTTAGGLPANCVASWNGSAWMPVGSGMSGGAGRGVFALTIFNDQLIAGGYFTAAGDYTANSIAAWASW